MTESFLVQLDVDIEGTAFRDIRRPTGETPLERVRPHTTVSMDNVKVAYQLIRCQKKSTHSKVKNSLTSFLQVGSLQGGEVQEEA